MISLLLKFFIFNQTLSKKNSRISIKIRKELKCRYWKKRKSKINKVKNGCF